MTYEYNLPTPTTRSSNRNGDATDNRKYVRQCSSHCFQAEFTNRTDCFWCQKSGQKIARNRPPSRPPIFYGDFETSMRASF